MNKNDVVKREIRDVVKTSSESLFFSAYLKNPVSIPYVRITRRKTT
jgi:hypothetical protein